MKTILQYIWLATALAALVIGIINTINMEFSESYPLFIIFVVAFFMFLLRRAMNKQSEETR